VHDVRLDANDATEWIITTAISQISMKSSKVSAADGLEFFNAHSLLPHSRKTLLTESKVSGIMPVKAM
jgi:hypothetical protein